MKPLPEMLKTGFICKYQPADIPYFLLLGDDAQILDGCLNFGLSYFFEAPAAWQCVHNMVTSIDTLECITMDHRMMLVQSVTDFPVTPIDPIILSLLNKVRFEAILRTLHAIKEQGLLVQLSYDEAEKDLLLEQTINTEELMPHHSTVVLLCIEIYLGIGTKAALERAVLLGTDSGYGAAVDQLILEAKEKLKQM